VGEFADHLARLRAHVEGRQPLPFDLGAWVIGQLSRIGGADVLRVERDQHLITAGELVGGPVRRRAAEILAADRALSRAWTIHAQRAPELGTLRGHVHAARLFAPVPADRQLRIILSAGAGWSNAA
jgi:hypothetical protein